MRKLALMKEVRVSAAVIVKDGRIYATRRTDGEQKGFWEFPGGKIEKGEKAEDALLREIREELGVKIAIRELLTTVSCQYPSFFLVMNCFICVLEEGEMELSVHDRALWLKETELDSVKWLPADELVVKAIRKKGIGEFI